MSTFDPPDHDPWLDSQERSRVRRAGAARRLRRLRGRRSTVAVALGSLALASGAVAQTKTPEPPVAPADPAPVMGVEAVGVEAVQRALGVQPVDGVAGPRTRRAIRRFQRERSLVVDGIAGPQTLAALGLAAAPRPASQRGGGKLDAVLGRIALCESGGDPEKVSVGGVYRGKYQFHRDTWRRLGGSGDPDAAPEAEQDRLAAKLLAQQGTAPWAGCAG